MGLFRVKLSRVETGRISCPEIGLFTLEGKGKVKQFGQLEGSVGGTWQSEVRGEQPGPSCGCSGSQVVILDKCQSMSEAHCFLLLRSVIAWSGPSNAIGNPTHKFVASRLIISKHIKPKFEHIIAIIKIFSRLLKILTLISRN